MPSRPIPLTDEENALFQPAAGRLFSLVNDHAIDVVFDAAFDQAEGSNLAIATASKCREAYDRFMALVLSAQAQLLTLRLLIERGLLTDSPLYTLLRGAGEATVRARHLGDPNLDETTRLARALAERSHNLDEQRKAQRTRGEESLKGPILKDYLDRVDKFHERRARHLARRGTALKIQVTRNAKGEPVFGNARRTDFELFQAYMPRGGSFYRVVSGHAHSMQWAQLQADRAEPTQDPTVGAAPTDIRITEFVPLLNRVLDLHDDNAVFLLTHTGHSIEAWEAAKRTPLRTPS